MAVEPKRNNKKDGKGNRALVEKNQCTSNAHLNTDLDMSFTWLREGSIKSETESLLTATQEQVLKTRSIETRIHRTTTDPQMGIAKHMNERLNTSYRAANYSRHESI